MIAPLVLIFYKQDIGPELLGCPMDSNIIIETFFKKAIGK
jgi:hypothetical protein